MFRVDYNVAGLSIDNIVAFGLISAVDVDEIFHIGFNDIDYKDAKLKLENRSYSESEGSSSTLNNWTTDFPDYYPYIMLDTLSI